MKAKTIHIQRDGGSLAVTVPTALDELEAECIAEYVFAKFDWAPHRGGPGAASRRENILASMAEATAR